MPAISPLLPCSVVPFASATAVATPRSGSPSAVINAPVPGGMPPALFDAAAFARERLHPIVQGNTPTTALNALIAELEASQATCHSSVVETQLEKLYEVDHYAASRVDACINSGADVAINTFIDRMDTLEPWAVDYILQRLLLVLDFGPTRFEDRRPGHCLQIADSLGWLLERATMIATERSFPGLAGFTAAGQSFPDAKEAAGTLPHLRVQAAARLLQWQEQGKALAEAVKDPAALARVRHDYALDEQDAIKR